VVTRPKDKGTAAETLVARYLRKTYWPHAERRALSGGQDKGDITGTPGLVWEVKAAKTLCVPAWLRETEAERQNADADYATLVIKPVGVGATRVGEWYALMDRDRFREILVDLPFSDWAPHTHTLETTVRKMSLAHALLAVSLNPKPQHWVYYPKFVATHLIQMVGLLNMAGYGSDIDNRKKDHA
jgi:hypothetical protein